MKRIIIANWKMAPQTSKEAKKIFERVKTKAKKIKGADIVIAPPEIYLSLFGPSGNLKIGAQDVSAFEQGAWTGEVSAKMLKNLGVSYVLIGHSERRELGESEEMIHEKMYQALSHGLRAVLCVGEKEKNREAFPSLVREEIKSALKGIPRRLASRTIIAYEPVWAISSHSGGKADSPQNFFEMSIYIRRIVLDIWGKAAALKIPIIYGGSVNSKNAAGFLQAEGGSGLLVGRASLSPEEFNKILDEANKNEKR